MVKDLYPELTSILRDAGWFRVPGGKGSHEKWRHDGSDATIIVPRTNSRHTANGVLKQAGLPKTL